jgi:very-short-patch-repair endonuclease
VRQAGLPQPQTNVRLGRYEADFLWAAEKVIVEVDSWRYHGNPRAFERDRRKDLALQTAGYQVIRITAKQLELEPYVIVAQIARALDRAARSRG